MNVLMPYKTRVEALIAVREVLEKEGHNCELLYYENAKDLRERLQTGNFFAVLCAENFILSKIKPVDNRSCRVLYVSPDFFCAAHSFSSCCDAYIIPNEALSIDFIKAGAKESKLFPFGIPLQSKDLERPEKYLCMSKWGLSQESPVFSVFAESITTNEIKSTVRSIRFFSKQGQILLFTNNPKRQNEWRASFSDDTNVFILEEKGNRTAGISVADAVFVPAFSSYVCSVALQGKSLIFLHSAVPYARKNAKFLNQNGIGFCGKTAEDNASFANRMLENKRLLSIMQAAQQKYIVQDAAVKTAELIEKICENHI